MRKNKYPPKDRYSSYLSVLASLSRFQTLFWKTLISAVPLDIVSEGLRSPIFQWNILRRRPTEDDKYLQKSGGFSGKHDKTKVFNENLNELYTETKLIRPEPYSTLSFNSHFWTFYEKADKKRAIKTYQMSRKIIRFYHISFSRSTDKMASKDAKLFCITPRFSGAWYVTSSVTWNTWKSFWNVLLFACSRERKKCLINNSWTIHAKPIFSCSEYHSVNNGPKDSVSV